MHPIKLITLFAVLAAGGVQAAEVVYLRTGEPRGFRVSGASNATPVVLTTMEAHGLSADDTIVVTNICGTTAANGIRKVKTVIDSTHFSIKTLADIDVPGNGDWCDGSIPGAKGGFQGGGKAHPYALADHPRVWLDGPTGPLTRWISLGIHNGLTSVVASSNSCTLTTTFDYDLHDGDKIAVWNSSSSALNGVARTVTRVSGTSYTFPCANVANGTYSTAGMRVSAFGFPGNPPWDRIVTQSTGLVTNYTKYYTAYNNQVSYWFGSAMRWFVDPSQTTHLNIAKHFINHYEDNNRGNYTCKEDNQNCQSGDTDYNSYFNVPTALIYTLIRSQMTEGEISTFANKVLNDKADGCSPAVRTLDNHALSGSGTTLTGTGTEWLTNADPTKRLAAGDLIWTEPSIDSYSSVNPIRIYSVESDTSLTMDVPWNGSRSTYDYTHKWKSGDCGEVWFLKHHPASITGHPSEYPTSGGTDGGEYAIGHSNTGITKASGHLSLMLALADDDERARNLLAYTWNYTYDEQLPWLLGWATGAASQSGSAYGYGRVSWMSNNLTEVIRNSIIGYPSLPATDAYALRHGPWMMFHYLPDSTIGTGAKPHGLAYGSGWVPLSYDAPQGIPMPAMNKAKTSNEMRYFKDWLLNRWQVGAPGAIRSLYMHNWFLWYNPTVQPLDYTTQPTQYLFRSTSKSTADQLGGMSNLIPSWAGFGMWISRTGWTSPSDTLVYHMAKDYKSDHDGPQAGSYRVYKRGYFIANDMSVPGVTYGDSDGNVWNTDGVFDIGGVRSTKAGDGLSWPNHVVDANITRWAKTDPTGDADSRYVYSLTELKDTFAIPVTRAQRHLAHLKKPGSEEILIAYDDVALPSANTIHGQVHNYLNRVEAQTGFSQGGGTSTITLSAAASATDDAYTGHYISIYTGEWQSGKITGYVGSTKTATVTPSWKSIPPANTWYTIGLPATTITCPGSGGCAAFSANRTLVSQSPTDTVITKYIDPTSGNTRMYLDDVNGVYPAGRGYSFRTSYCASDDGASCSLRSSMEAVVVHRIVEGTSDQTLNVTPLSAAGWTGVQTADKVALFARNGELKDGVAFTTSHAGVAQYLVAGLAEGIYAVTVGGNSVSGSPFTVARGDHSMYFESGSGQVVIIRSGSTTNLIVNHTTVAFALTTSSTSPATQAVTLDSDGSQLGFEAISNASWLSVSPATGATAQPLTLSADASGLGTGTFSATVTINSPLAVNNPQTIGVTLRVTDAPPALVTVPASVEFATLEGYLAAPQTLAVGTTTGAPLTGTISAATTPEWLLVSPASFTTPQSVNLLVDSRGLAAGTYLGSILLSADGAANSPMTVLAQLTVWPRPGPGMILRTVKPGKEGAVVFYGRPGLDANQRCVVDVSQDLTFGTVLESIADQGGHAIRQAVLGTTASLAPESSYYVKASCGGEVAVAQFATSRDQQAAPVPVEIGKLPWPGVQSALIEYGSTPLLSQNASINCALGCTFNIPASGAGFTFVKHTFLNGTGDPIARGRAQPVALP